MVFIKKNIILYIVFLISFAFLFHLSERDSEDLQIKVKPISQVSKDTIISKDLISDTDSLRRIITTNYFSSEIFKTDTFRTKISDYKNIILVDLDSNKILHQYKAFEMVEIASITKLMSVLLIMEALENKRISLNDTLVASRKSSLIGGSQIYLKEKEKMIVEDLLKSIIIKSANDATFLMAETLGENNSVADFVKQMNKKAVEIGMLNSIFYYPHGLPPSWSDRKKKKIEGNLSTCYDLAILSKELLKYSDVTKYSSIWLDSIRTEPGKKPFQLRNTSRLIKDYNFFDGLKTGFYNKAGFCIVATALKEKRRLVAVILGSRSQRKRNKLANELVSWGYKQIAKTDSIKKALLDRKMAEKIIKNQSKEQKVD